MRDFLSIPLNNAKQVIEELQKSDDIKTPDLHLTMVEDRNYNAVKVTDKNIHNNAMFILNLWD